MIGTTLAHYRIDSLLGAGGMGEVYRAHDTKLGRAVAVKVLPDAFAYDPDRVARFEREAKVLASLNHPHIAALYGMEESGGRHFLVMELVEGETLAERLRRGAIAVDEALKVAHQIVDALEAAHEKGIVHRDLKPANVKITPEEKVKVLDFGLAKAMEPASQGSGHSALTHSPTLSMAATQAGMILGTAAYMSPEQAQGLTADARSDVFSFGVVLFEMLTGRQPFFGDTAAAILASVIVREADLGALPPDLNPRLRELLGRCLEKNPKRRWQAVGDLRAEVEAVRAAPHSSLTVATVVAPPLPLWKRAIPVAAASLLTAAITSGVWWSFRPSPAPPPVTRFPFTLGEGQQFSFVNRQLIDISPDGTQIVYAVNRQLYLRSMSELEARAIPGTETGAGVANPVFSPDGRSIAFWSIADQTLKKIAVSGGAAVTICRADSLFGMSWGADGILFGQGTKGILRVSANGGKPEVIVSVKSDEAAHGPQVLPGGQVVLFTLATANTSSAGWDKARIVVQSLKSGERKTLIEGGSDARYLPTGHIVYALGGVVFAVPFDLPRLEVTKGPVPVVEGVRRSGGFTGSAQFAVSRTGSLVFIPGPAGTSSGQLGLGLTDLKGISEPLRVSPGTYTSPRMSPDGKNVAFGTDEGKEANISIYDLVGTNLPRRLTFGGRNRFPIWSADGQRVTFQSDFQGDLAIFWQRADGAGIAERLTKPEQGTSHVPDSWSPDGKTLLLDVVKGSSTSLWAFTLQDPKAVPFGNVQALQPTNAVFSPNGRWVAYTSNEGGTSTVYVQPFPATGAKYQLPTSHHAVWAPDGKSLFYVPNTGGLAVVSVTTLPTFTFGNPSSVPRGFATAASADVRNHDITPDGQRFIGTTNAGQGPPGASSAPQIHVVLNWFEELKTQVPVK